MLTTYLVCSAFSEIPAVIFGAIEGLETNSEEDSEEAHPKALPIMPSTLYLFK